MACERPPRLRRNKVASRLLIDRAATPPREEGKAPTTNSLAPLRGFTLARLALPSASATAGFPDRDVMGRTTPPEYECCPRYRLLQSRSREVPSTSGCSHPLIQRR